MDLRILFENGDMVAVEKPQGMPAQPDRTGDADLLSLLSAQMKQELGLVHRLDRPVGGIMVFAKTKQAEAALSKMMQAGGWQKSYLTVLWGTLEEKSGTWTDYLFKNARTNLSEVVSASRKGAKKAILHYQVLAETMWNDQPLSLVEITLETGRHHQIRVQTSHHGAPIWGDRKYNTLQSMRGIGNMALWSWKLEGKWEKQKDGFSIRSLPSDMPFSLFSEKLGEL